MTRKLAPILGVLACIALASAMAVPEDGVPDEELTPAQIAQIDSFVKRFRHAQRLLGRGDDEAAEQVLRDLLREEPDVPEVHHALGTLLRFRGRMDEAGEALVEAAALAPKDGVIQRDAGLHLFEVGRAAEAEAHFRRAALRLDGDVETMAGLAASIRAQGRVAEAAAYYRKAIAIDPDSVDARVGLAACLVVEDPAKALEILEPIPPNWADVLLTRGLALERLGRFELATEQLRSAADRAAPGRAGVPFLREASEALVRCGAAEPAAAAARRWVAAEGGRPGPRSSFCLALALAAGGKSDAALKALDRATGLEKAPPGVRAHVRLFRAALLLEDGRPEDARPVLEELAAAPAAVRAASPGFERRAARRLLGRDDAATFASAAQEKGRANDVAWIESLVAGAAGRGDARAEQRRRAAELSSPPGEYPGLLVRPVQVR